MEKMSGKTPSQSLTCKFITPCRTFGLKRKSPKIGPAESPISSKRDKPSSSLSETSVNIISNTSGLMSPTFKTKGRLNRPLLSSDSPIQLNKLVVEYKNGLQNSPYISPRERTSFNSPATPLNPQKLSRGVKLASSRKFTCRRSALPMSPESSSKCDTNNKRFRDKEYSSKVTHLISSVNKKTLELKCLRTNEIYTKKHNLKDLMSLTDKWKQSCRAIVQDLVAKLKERGEHVTIEDVIRQHHIPFEFLGFSPEAEDFV